MEAASSLSALVSLPRRSRFSAAVPVQSRRLARDQIPFGVHLGELGQLAGGLDLALRLSHGQGGGQGAQLDGHLVGGAGLQRQVQIHPGTEHLLLGFQLVHLGPDSGQPPGQIVDLHGGGPGLLGAGLTEQLPL